MISFCRGPTLTCPFSSVNILFRQVMYFDSINSALILVSLSCSRRYLMIFSIYDCKILFHSYWSMRSKSKSKILFSVMKLMKIEFPAEDPYKKLQNNSITLRLVFPSLTISIPKVVLCLISWLGFSIRENDFSKIDLSSKLKV